MGLSQPDFLYNNNPNEPLNGFSTQLKGGRRYVNNVSDLYTLTSVSNQLDQYITVVRVLSTSDDWILVDSTNIGNSSGWALSQSNTAGGELSGQYPNPTVLNSAVLNKVLTGLSISGSTILSSDNIITAFGKVQNQINGLVGGVMYQGVWNASTNTPPLASGVGTKGHLYKVSVAGNTNLDGQSNWSVGDQVVFDGNAWDGIDGVVSEVLGFNGRIGNVTLTTGDVNAVLATSLGTVNVGVWNGSQITDSYISSSGNWNTAYNDRVASLTTSGNNGSSTFVGNVLNIPTYTLAGLGASTVASTGNYSDLIGKPTALSQFTNDSGYLLTSVANGLFQPLENQRLSSTNNVSFNSVISSTYFTVNNSSGSHVSYTSQYIEFGDTATGALYQRIQVQPTISGNGVFLLPNKTGSYTLATTADISSAAISLTTTGNSGASTLVGGTLNIPNYSISLTTTGNSGAASFASNTLNVPTYTLAGLGASTVASTGNYSDLSGRPTAVSAFSNDSGYITGGYTGFDTRYQPLENQRLSSSNDVTFSKLRANGIVSSYYNLGGQSLTSYVNSTLSGITLIGNNRSGSAAETSIISISGNDVAAKGGFNFSTINTSGTETQLLYIEGDTFKSTFAGDVYATGFYQTSQRELKKNIEEYTTEALPLINSLKVNTFQFKSNDTENHIGFIVDEVDGVNEAILNSDKTAINKDNLIAQLTKAVQELSQELLDIKQILKDANLK